ncbi:MAG: DNA polymerase III subunit gamma/tau [Acidobacteriota bacterium]|jgi:DNA polymerase-3 subunit gamma/tau|nr:DNA polymerase III subunit gamma/tau [Acidobacteriota bacterium]
MQYQVLARKWRPRNFHELVGQEHVSRSLLNALRSGRLAHAFLFSGPRGSGKTTSARILAKALNCHEGNPGEPCSKCPACIEIAAGSCLDVLEIDAASNRGIDEIRELKEKVRYNPARDRNRIFIIDEVHMLTSEAFNALLKTLEEPPPRVVFILATTEHHKIPATILSRCQQYTFKLIPYPRILDRLREIALAEGIQISDGALELVTFASGGSMRDAMSALDQVLAFCGGEVRDEDAAALLGMVEANVLGRTVRAIAENNPTELLEVVAGLAEAGQDLNNFCRRLSGQFRNLMVLKAGVSDTALLGVPESLLPELREQSELFSREELIRLFDTFQKIETGMKYATQVRFQLEMGLIELAHAARLRPIEDLIAEFSAFADDDDDAASAAPPPRPEKSSAPAASTAPPPAAGRSDRRAAPMTQAVQTESPKDDLLEKAKNDPIVRSFMDIFPGPVSAEKIEK